MKEKLPLVSIYIPTKNRLKLLKRAINSVIAQTYPNIELIIVDDGSTDGTKEYLKTLEKESNIVVIYRDKSYGATNAKNMAITKSKGEFLTGLDDDDFIFPDRIEHFVNFWKKLDKPIAGLFDKTLVRSKNGHYIRNEKKYVTISDLRKRNYIGNSIFAPRSHYLKAGLLDENIPAWHDWDLWVRMSQLFGDFINIDYVTYVMDESHEFPRMTTNEERKIRKAMEIFSKKNEPFSFFERSAILIALNEYPQVKLNLSEMIILLLNGRFRSFFKALKKKL